MKKQIVEFEGLKKYVVCKGDNFNGDRCFNIRESIVGIEYDVTMCLNENSKSVAICEVHDAKGNEISEDSLIPKLILTSLTISSENAAYTEQELKYYNFYSSVIEKSTICCTYNCEKCCNKMKIHDNECNNMVFKN